MPRTKLAAALLVAALLGVVVWLLSAHKHGTVRLGSKDVVGASKSTGAATVGPRQRGEPLNADPDPVGQLRLEGQVVDDDERPVAGATIHVSSTPPRVVTSEGDGSFSVDGLLPRTYRLLAWHERDCAGPTRIRLRADTEPVILRLRAGDTLVVTVLNEEGDAPISGALVTSYWGQQATTGPTGVAVLRGLLWSMDWVSINAEGYAPTIVTLSTHDPGGRHERTVRLVRGARVSGVVTRPDGAPFGRAVVTILGKENGVWAAETESSADGRWQFDVIPRGRYSMVADATGLLASEEVWIDVDGVTPRDDLTLRVRDGHEIRGIVINLAGVPVAGARVDANGSSTSSGPDGRFLVRGLAEVRHSVFATFGDEASAVVMVVPGREEANSVRLEIREATIQGIVLDAAGEPVAEAEINAQNTEHGIHESAIADSAGRFVLSPLPPGEYVLRPARPGSSVADRRVGRSGDDHRVRAMTGARDVELRLPATGSITGIVLSDVGPVGLFGLAVGPSGSEIAKAGVTIIRSPNGRFERHHLRAGEWSLAIVGEGFARTIVSTFEVLADKTTDLGTIVVTVGGTITGSVVDAMGAGVAGATVIVGYGDFDDPMTARLRDEHSATSRADGTFTIANIAGSSVRAFARHPHLGQSPETEVPIPGTVNLELAPTGEIEGFAFGFPNEEGMTLVSAGIKVVVA
jgi:hypothetical protein